MKKLLITPENPNGTIVDMTAEEVALKEQDDANSQARDAELDKKLKQKEKLTLKVVIKNF